jgi:hypothetical protein
VLVQFQNLRELELFIEGANDPNMNYFWILDIAMTSQHLEKLSLTVSFSMHYFFFFLLFTSFLRKC